MPTMLTGHVRSADGTRISYRAGGAGPPLVMVHGALADHTTMARLVPLLEPQFTVYTPDRRGRGASGDGPVHTVEHEYADVAAVVDAVAGQSGARVALYGHSFGATCALGAALRTANVGRLALYEPAFRGVFRYPAGLLDRLDALVGRGDAERAVELAFRERVGLSAAEVEALRELPSWPARVAAAATVPRELRVDATLAFEPARHRALGVPTLLIEGERSAAGQLEVVAALDRALPDSRIAVLPGQAHMAQLTAPELVARELIRFLAEPSGR